MATSCVFNDFVKRRRASIMFTEDNFLNVINSWEKEDKMLTDLQPIEVFRGFTRWDQLDPIHFRLLITNTLNNRDKNVDESKHFDNNQPYIATLYFLIMSMAYSMQRRTGGAVDTIRINRASELDVTFEFTITMMPEDKKKEPNKSGLQVIVDNT